MASRRWMFMTLLGIIAFQRTQCCSTNLTGEGNITSPNYPAEYPNSAYCTWHLSASPGRILQIFCRAFDLENNFDYVSVTSPVPNKTTLYSYRLTGNSTNCSWTVGLTASVLFTSDYSIQRPGFVLGFRSIVPTTVNWTRFTSCGGRLNDSGSIMTPNYPAAYPGNTLCIWYITAKEGRSLRFTASSFDVESGYDNVKIYNAMNNNATIFESGDNLWWWTGSVGLEVGPTAIVVFSSDLSVERNGFWFNFWSELSQQTTSTASPISSSCGTNLTGEGSITSPNYPASYPNSAYCSWSLFASPGMNLQIFCRSFELEENYDYLVITGQVPNKMSSNTYRLTGSSTNCSWTFGQSAYVIFTSDGSIQRPGFVLGFRSVLPPTADSTRFTSCGGRLNGYGTVTSPNYPDTYPGNAFCVWNITAQGGNSLRFSVTSFDLEYGYDYVKIYNSSQINDNATVFSSGDYPRWWSGSVNLAAGPTAVVLFTSDVSIEQRGFILNFWSELTMPSTSSTPVTSTSVYVNNGGCAFNLTGEGNITSPNYPAAYPSFAYCTWSLFACPGMNLQLFCIAFDLENNYDYLTVTGQVPNKTSSRSYRLTGNSPNCSWTFGQTASLLFTSDGSIQRTGFVLAFRSVAPLTVNSTRFTACGGQSNGSGIVMSPNYPAAYPSNAFCVWYITAQEGNLLRFTVNLFDMEYGYDYVKIYSASQINDNATVFSSEDYPWWWSGSVNLATGPNAVVVFSSDVSIEQSGFWLSYWSESTMPTASSIPPTSASNYPNFRGCGANLTGQGNITSPNYPDSYPNSAYCVWNLTSSPGKVLHIFCYLFDLENNYDYLVVTGPVPNKTTSYSYRMTGITSQCSWTIGQSASVLFTSDGSVQRPGFVLGFRSVDPSTGNTTRFTSCGGRLNGSGIITSPNYPAAYPGNALCVWYITAQGGNWLRFSVNSFDVEYGYDNIRIYNSAQINSNATVFSAGNYPLWWSGSVNVAAGPTAVVVFSSDQSIEQSGFSMSFWSEWNMPTASSTPVTSTITYPNYRECGGNITGQGSFTSPFYPGSYPRRATCIWYLKAAAGKVLQIDVQNIELEDQYDFLIFNTTYPNRTTPESFKFTGYRANVTLILASAAYVIFQSDTSIELTGFRVVVSSVTATLGYDKFYRECNTTITAPGTLLSPSYPSNYPLYADCQWTVRAPVGKFVSIQFLDFSTIQGYDVLRIFQDENVTCGTPFNTYSGNSVNGSIIFGRAVVAAFSSSSFRTAAGFRLFISFVIPATTLRPVTATTAVPITRCGATISGAGRLRSPNYPLPYKPNTRCIWKLNRQANRPSTLRINSLRLESPWDSVRVYLTGTPAVNEVPAAEYTGNISGVIASFNATTLTVIFESDESFQLEGFDITFYSNASSRPPTALLKKVLPQQGVCGVPAETLTTTLGSARIVGGTDALPGAWPWQAMLYYLNSFICGGSLIAPQWVLTAAHCIISSSPNNFNVTLGKHYATGSYTTEQRFAAVKVIRHPAYHSESHNSDLALIKLQRPVTFNAAIRPVCLPITDAPPGSMCYISGWGETKGTGNVTVLRQAAIPALSRQCCKDFLGDAFSKNMSCAGYLSGGKDTCQGDSGGPFVCNINGAFWLHGITSWGNGCGRPYYPGAYTRVPSFIKWINETVSLN